MKKLLLVAGLANFFLLSSGQNNSVTNVDCPDAVNRFTERVLVVSTRLLQSFINSTSCENVAMTPMGIMLNLIGIAYFAEGQTKKETYDTLGLESREEMVCVANVVNNESYYLPDCIEFGPATDYFANQYQFTSEFKRVMTDVVVGEAINLNNSTNPTSSINSKVAMQTDNRITNVIPDSSIINPSSQIISITAAFFTGTWQIGMQSTDEVTEFRVSPSISEKQTFLYADAVYLYAYSEILQAQIVQINFCCEAFYMWEILPDCPFTENSLIEKMALNTDWYYDVLNKMELINIKLYFPIYNYSLTSDIRARSREATGLETVYNAETIDLKGAIEGDRPAAVTVGIHKVYLKTGFEGGPVPKEAQSEEPKKTVKIDSPHVWIIFRNGRVHYIGVTRTRVA